MVNGKTVTVIVPSFNEEENIENTVKNILLAINNYFDDYEILLFDDGSTDRTGKIIDKLAAENLNVKAIHNGINRGFGYSYNQGVELSSMGYISVLPGDNEIHERSMSDMFKLIGNADIIVPYVINTEVRPRTRRIVSSLYIFIMNLLFKCDLHYYTGPAILKSEFLKNIPLKTSSFAFISSVLVRLIRSGHSFIEVPIYLKKQVGRRSKAFRIKNVIGVIWTIIKLFWETEFVQKEKYNKFPIKRVIPYI